MTDLIDTTEMYLRTILELEEEHIIPLRARISERIGHSGPTVSQTVARMERDGLVLVTDDRHLELTHEGRQKAIAVMRKHRIAERLLADVIGLEWQDVHEEACRWEHVMSESVERKIMAMLNYPTESPYGNPIPGLDELGLPPTAPFHAGVINVQDVLPIESDSAEPVQVIVRRLAEPVQSDSELLTLFRRSGLYPDARASVTMRGETVIFQVMGYDVPLELSIAEAAHIFVAE